MVQNLIHERMLRQDEAVFEVSSKHAESQSITGPVLTIPYVVTKQVKNADGTYRDAKERYYYHILPEELNIQGQVTPEKRKRGLFEVVVYSSDLKVNGHFDSYRFEDHGINEDELELNKAFVTIGIADLKGVTDQVISSLRAYIFVIR